MKLKIAVLIEFFIIVILFAALIMQFVSFGESSLVVRAPGAPEESGLSYTPPPKPKLLASNIKTMAELSAEFRPKVIQVTEDIYYAKGFSLGGVQMVITDQGLVIIDSTENIEAAKTIFAEFRKITDKPVKYLIYTHGHVDHVAGASAFMAPGVEVIATADCVELLKRDFGWLARSHNRRRAIQSGKAAPDYSRSLPFKSVVNLSTELNKDNLVWPTITFEKEYSFVLGGKTFELKHTMGETPDHLMVWIPEDRALFCGDLYYRSFPNLHSPMLAPRPVKQWYESLDKMAALNAEHLIPGHTDPVSGADKVRETLTAHSAAIRSVYEQTIECINKGVSVEEAVSAVRLPDHLASRDHLQEHYGRIDWAVRGIYQGETGWYDGKGSGLAPLPPGYVERELAGISGGADRILERAIQVQKQGEHQLACQLCDVIIKANPEDRLARIIKAESLDHLAFQCGNLNMMGFYRSAAAMERKAAAQAMDDG